MPPCPLANASQFVVSHYMILSKWVGSFAQNNEGSFAQNNEIFGKNQNQVSVRLQETINRLSSASNSAIGVPQ